MRSWFAAGIAGAVLMFLWTSIAHVATPLGQTGFSQIPNEAPVLAAMHDSMGDKPGLYFFPWVDMKAKDAMEQSAAKMKANPSGLLLYHPPGRGIEMMPASMGLEFGKEAITVLIAAFLLAQTVIAGYAARVGFVSLVGVAAALTTNASYWIWYGFPAAYTLAYGFIDFSGYVVAGLAIAAVLRKQAA
ncbi:MAG: hypothetical protein ABSD74_06290 [Rhizomicrobium sp.]|jgi:hypothetical protein